MNKTDEYIKLKALNKTSVELRTMIHDELCATTGCDARKHSPGKMNMIKTLLVFEIEAAENDENVQQIKQVLDAGLFGWKNTIVGKYINGLITKKSTAEDVVEEDIKEIIL